MALLAQAARLGLRRLAPWASRPLCTSQARWQQTASNPATSQGGAGKADQDDDIVLEAVKEQQRQFRALLEGVKDIDVPLNGDEGALRRYAQQMEALKKKVGMPDIEEVVTASLEYQLRCAGFNLRKFLAAAVEGADMGPYRPVVDDLSAAVGEIEKATGAPLDANNQEGWKQLEQRMQAIQKKHNLDNYEKVKEEAILDMYKDQVQQMREAAVTEMEAAKARDHLDWVQTDLSKLKPKPI